MDAVMSVMVPLNFLHIVVPTQYARLIYEQKNGQAWELTRDKDMRPAEQLQDKEDPTWIVGATPCADMSALNAGTDLSRMDPAVVVERGLTKPSYADMCNRQRLRGKPFSARAPKVGTLMDMTAFDSFYNDLMCMQRDTTNVNADLQQRRARDTTSRCWNLLLFILAG